MIFVFITYNEIAFQTFILKNKTIMSQVQLMLANGYKDLFKGMPVNRNGPNLFVYYA